MSRLEPLRQALAQSPDNVPLLMVYGAACLEELAADEARRAFERVLVLSPGSVEAAVGLSRSLTLLGRTSEAVVRLEAVVAAQPGAGLAHRELARLLAGEGNLAAAREAYARAVAVDARLADPALEKELGEGGRGAGRMAVGGAGPVATPAGEALEDGEEAGDLDRIAEYELAAEMERPSLAFADVGGMEAVKEQVRMKILFPLQHPEMFKAYGKKAGGGVLLYGPPGCGKTLLSRAVAGEIRAHFLAVGIHQVLDMWLGKSEQNLHQLFEVARRHAPAVVFFDEVDALAANRADLRGTAGRTLINQFLAEMDGTQGENDGVLVLGATNAPWHLDPAFLRPGRFDRVIFVPPPDEGARRAVLEVLLRDKPAARVDVAAVAKRTGGFSGADLRAVVDQASERALETAMRKGKVVPLETDDLVAAAKVVKPSTRAWFESARNHALYANQSGFYDDVLVHLGMRKP